MHHLQYPLDVYCRLDCPYFAILEENQQENCMYLFESQNKFSACEPVASQLQEQCN
jgi:hypothetical protein